MTRRWLTEKEAWGRVEEELLAQGRRWSVFLCNEVRSLHTCGLISDYMLAKMLRKITKTHTPSNIRIAHRGAAWKFRNGRRVSNAFKLRWVKARIGELS